MSSDMFFLIRRYPVFVLIFVVMLGLPAILILELLSFIQEVNVSDAVLYTTAEVIRYPNLTVCHSRYFDKARMQGDIPKAKYA